MRHPLLLALTALAACATDPCEDAVIRTESMHSQRAWRVDVVPDGGGRAEVWVADMVAGTSSRVVQEAPSAPPVVDAEGRIRLAPGGDARWAHCVTVDHLPMRCVVGGPEVEHTVDGEGRVRRLASGASERTWTWDECDRPGVETVTDEHGVVTVITYRYRDHGHLSGWVEERWDAAASASTPEVTEVDVIVREGWRPMQSRAYRDGVWLRSVDYDRAGREVHSQDAEGGEARFRTDRYGFPLLVERGGVRVYQEVWSNGQRVVDWNRDPEGVGTLVRHRGIVDGDRECIAPERLSGVEAVQHFGARVSRRLVRMARGEA